MEQTQKPDVNKVLNQMQMIKFQGVFMAAWELLKKEPLMLLALFLAPMIVVGVLQSYVYPYILGAVSAGGAITLIVVIIILTVVSVLINFFGFGMVMRAASLAFDGKKVDPAVMFSFVQTHFVNAIKLAINIFIYTGGWILIAYFVAAALLTPIIPFVGGILMMLSPIAVIIYIILFFTKIVNASMSYAVFWSAEKPEVDGSLKRSLELCNGLTWTIFGNYFLMGLVGGLASALLIGILGAVFAVLGRAAAELAGAFAGGVVGAYYVLFQYCLKGQVEKFRGSHHVTPDHSVPAPTHHTPEHHHAPEHHTPTHHSQS